MAQVVRDVRQREYEELSGSRYALLNLAKHLAPNIVGLHYAKKAAILALLSMDDTVGDRGRSHLLFTGPPGGAKTSIMGAAARECGMDVWSPRLSEGGITVDLRSREPRPGILSKAHDSEFQVVALDEVDKLEPGVLGQLLMAMEDGYFTYAGGASSGRINAHVRVLAACNNPEKLPREVLDRFDYRIHMPAPKRSEAHHIVRGMTAGFMRPTAEAAGPSDGFVQGYLRWARTHKPEFPDEERALSAHIFQLLVDEEQEDAVQLRPYEAVMRAAYSIARLERANVTAERVMDAVQVLHPDRDYGAKFDALRSLLGYLRKRGYRKARY